MVDLAKAYINKVESGEILCGKLVKQAVMRHKHDLIHAEDRGFVFDEKKAAQALSIFGLLRHTSGQFARQPFNMQEWQAFLIYCIFGWRRKKDGRRRFSKAYVEIARKAGKSELAAGFGLLGAFFDGEFGAEVYSAANKYDQASICWKSAIQMVKFMRDEDPSLRGVFGIYEAFNNRRIVSESQNSFFAPVASDSKTLDGLRPHFAIVDEYHEARDDSILRVLETGMVSRTQPLLFIITTAGFNRNGPCYHLRKVVCDILEEKKTDDSLFGLIFTLDEGDDWEDETVWTKANPSIGITPTWEAMRSQYVKAKNEGETARINFLTKNLNIWTTVAQTWIKDEDWMACQAPADLLALRGRPCYGGLDLASVRDITALVLFFPAMEKGESHIIVPYFWIPEDGAEQRSRDDGVPYVQWVADGLVEATPGNVTDYAYVKHRIMEIAELYQLSSIAYDRFNASQLVIELTDEGLNMDPFGQGFVSMSAPTRQIEKMVLSREINHLGNPVLRWMLGNVTLRMDPAGNIKMDKGKSQEKIDGMVALAMAVGEWMTEKKPEGGPSKYEDEEFTIL